MTQAKVSLEEYRVAQENLTELCQWTVRTRSRFHPAAVRHLGLACEVLGTDEDRVPDSEALQEARDHLLVVRELMGDGYDLLPAPDRLIRLCDNALKGTPGEGEQSQAPYE